MKRLTAVLSTSAAMIAVSTVPSFAAEKQVLPLDCGADGSFSVTVNGNGEFTPANDTGSTRVVVPISFQDFHFMATAPDGTVLVDETDPSVTAKGKGNPAAHSPRRQVTCTFSESIVLEEADDGFEPGTRLDISGAVTGYLTRAN